MIGNMLQNSEVLLFPIGILFIIIGIMFILYGMCKLGL